MNPTIQNSSHPALSGVDGLAAHIDVILLIGRILLGWIFVRSGYGKMFDIPAYAATFPARGCLPFWPTSPSRRSFSVASPSFSGWRPATFALVMVVFMLVATFSSHRY
jgi:uncharacterized membrane protein YphA (DoxX/SURF4 family)